MSKQSSIEFLISKIWTRVPPNEEEQKILDQARAMHKEEVITFTADWIIQWKEGDRHSIGKYYNETYKGGEQ